MSTTDVSLYPGPLHGAIAVPGDKSISHRALMLAAKSPDAVTVRNLNPGRDVRATVQALQAIGAEIELDGTTARVRGAVLHEPQHRIDCMNSGSTARMMLGVCTGANLRAQFDGDDSLRRRPMEPVAAQLRAFGAHITTANGTLPALLEGRGAPQTRRFILVSASAQIKTALLLAGVFSGTPVATLGDKGSRDHTERLLRYFGSDVTFDRSTVDLRSMPTRFADVDVAGDFSAAAFFIVAATVAQGSAITLTDVGVNPSRTGLLDALVQMGARIEIENPRERCGEPIADITVRSAQLHGISVGQDLALRAIDELLVLAVAAAFARGETRITGVQELRTKESDRLAAILRLMRAAGVPVEPLPNGLAIHGGEPRCEGALVETHGDHRTAMAAAALAAGAGGLRINDESSIEVSFPDFLPTLRKAQE
ncbi:MAG TPA: 3-phosphoshikimate 1-carboxyvinyltransferase [Candidatus Baltobacteraceae bacterium]|nr:3-phosphoshikimate 1-carboxyvinyltransferase [Candidatus Baltobacteraceae bacterium]